MILGPIPEKGVFNFRSFSPNHGVFKEFLINIEKQTELVIMIIVVTHVHA